MTEMTEPAPRTAVANFSNVRAFVTAVPTRTTEHLREDLAEIDQAMRPGTNTLSAHMRAAVLKELAAREISAPKI